MRTSARIAVSGFCGLAMLMFAHASFAADEFNRPGPYVGLGASGLISSFQGVLGRLHYGNTAGFSAHGGYRLNEFIAFDGMYEYGNDFGRSGRSFDHQFVTRNSSIQTNLFAATTKLILPLGRFQPYLDGGVGLLNVNGNVHIEDQTTGQSRNGGVSGTGFVGRFGAGLDVFLTENWSLFFDNAYTIPATGPTNVYYDSFGVGGRYNF